MSLEAIRRDIDAIDDGLLGLMVRRLAATARVRDNKAIGGLRNASPFRPAREAQLLRRLVAEGQGRIDPQFVVRLWRVILSSSIQEQAPVCLHLDQALAEDVEARADLAGHFCGFRIVSHPGMAALRIGSGFELPPGGTFEPDPQTSLSASPKAPDL